MIEVPISECGSYVDDCMIARTKFKIPRITEGNYQYVIQGVYSINAMGGLGKKFKEITINRYANLLKLSTIKKEEYYWISNGYLYMNNPSLKAVRITAYFEEEVPNEIMYPDSGCGGCNTSSSSGNDDDDLCKNPLDKEFALPGYLEKQALDLTSHKLLQTYFNLKTDMTNDGIDGQAPNAAPTR
jgi:hypothetical protein